MTASADLMEGWKKLDAATDAYLTALAYYKGTASERFANDRIRALVERTGQTYQFRFAAKPVNVMAKRCRLSNVTSDIESVTKLLVDIRDANQANIYEALIMKKAFMYGDSFALVWPVESDEDQDAVDGEELDVAAPDPMRVVGVEVSYQSPLHCRVVYDSEDGRRPRYAIRRWCESTALGDQWYAEVWYADRREDWVAKAGTKGATAEDWMPLALAEDEDGNPVRVQVEDGVNWPLDHDWGEIPIKHARTDLPYGEPVHAAAYGPQDAITKAITTQVTVDIEAHGWPERYRLLDDARMLEAGRDPVNWGDSSHPDAPEATVGAEPTGRRRGAGVEHVYPGTKTVGEYASPDPGDLIAPVDQWVRFMSVVSETPLDELDPTVQLSGVSREKADAPMRAKERDAKEYLEGFWQEVYSLAARMGGAADAGTISIHWAPPEVTMDADWWATAQLRLNMGVPVAQILAEANYEPDQIRAWLDAQGEELGLQQRIATLERLGAAIQTLGVGVQLGVLDQSTVNTLVTRVTGELKSTSGAGA